jgi:hypothetical protein
MLLLVLNGMKGKRKKEKPALPILSFSHLSVTCGRSDAKTEGGAGAVTQGKEG